MLKHTKDLEYREFFGQEMVTNLFPNVTEEDIKLITGVLKKLGMRFSYLKDRAINSFAHIDVFYKIPHIFKDDKGTQFCIGLYKKNTPKDKLDDKLCTINISKFYMRNVGNKDGDWSETYDISFTLYGHIWLYGSKKLISGHLPAGLSSIHNISEDKNDIKKELENKIKKLKSYIDNGIKVIE